MKFIKLFRFVIGFVITYIAFIVNPAFAQEGPKIIAGTAAASGSFVSKAVVEGENLLAAGADEAAEKKLSSVVAQSNNEEELAAAHFWLGEIYTKKYQLEKAAENFLKGFDLNNNSLYGGFNLYNLARTMKRLNKTEESCKIYMKYIEISLNKDALYLDSMKEKVKSEVEKNCKKTNTPAMKNA